MFAKSSRSGVGLQVSWLRVLRLNVGLRGFETAHKVALHSTVLVLMEAKLDAIITLWSHSQKQKHCELFTFPVPEISDEALSTTNN